MTTRFLTIGCLAMAATSPALADDWYVDDSAPGGGSGTSWTSPRNNLASVLLNDADNGDTIFVGQGTYKPTSGTDRTISFNLKQVEILGGYAGYGANDPNANNPFIYRTILSGNIGNTSLTSDNSYHVITASDGGMLPTNTLVQGVFIQDGNGDGSEANAGGGGVRITGGAAPRFDNCVIQSNLAGGAQEPPSEGFPSSYGAGIQSINSSPAFTQCIISNNISNGSGGAAYGGGIAVQGGEAEDSALFIDCEIRGNASTRGGGAAVKNSGVAVFANCLFTGNTASSGGGFPGFGGGISIDKAGDVTVINCTIADNTAPDGDAIALVSESGNSCTVHNSILWRTLSGGSNPIVYHNAGSLTITDSDVEGGWTGTGNINADPKFISPGLGNYRLKCDSPSKDEGENDYAQADVFDFDADSNSSEPAWELDQNDRIFGSDPDGDSIDMGAYERIIGCCHGDANGDGVVDIDDLLLVVGEWCVIQEEDCCVDCAGDIVDGNGEGGPCGGDDMVDINDLLKVIATWGSRCSGSSSSCSSTGMPQSVDDCMDDCSEKAETIEEWQECVTSCVEALRAAGIIQ